MSTNEIVKAFKTGFTNLALQGGSAGRNDCQWGWYDYVRELFSGRTVLDVGTGLSKIKERAPEWIVTTHEASEQCPADIHGDLNQIASCSFDAVTCFDVIEHVVDYGKLAWDMARISQRWLFITTPGMDVTLSISPFHFHEFHPWEVLNLLEATGMTLKQAWVQQWAGPAQFDNAGPINVLTGVIPASRQDLLLKEYLHPIALLMEHL